MHPLGPLCSLISVRRADDVPLVPHAEAAIDRDDGA